MSHAAKREFSSAVRGEEEEKRAQLPAATERKLQLSSTGQLGPG